MSFAYPQLLLLLLAVPVTSLAAVLGWHLCRKRWQEFVAPRLRGRLLKSSHPFRHWFALACLLLASALLCIAIARPRKVSGVEKVVTRSHDVAFAIDLSKSMLVDDAKPDRLSQAKTLIYEISDALQNDRVSLVGFAGTAHMFTPLTIDHGSLRETLDQLDPTWIPTGGSDLATGVRAGIETLKKGGSPTSALILLSDGEENEGTASELIDQANRAGVRIISIGIGTTGGGPVPAVGIDIYGNERQGFKTDRTGKRVISKLEPGLLKKLAEKTHGKYISSNDGAIPQMVNSVVSTLSAQEREPYEHTVYQELYAWFVVPAAFFALLGILGSTRWTGRSGRSGAAVAGAAMMLALQAPARAESPSSAEAWQKEAEKAITRERAAGYQLGAGDAAYQAKDYSTAADAYSAAQLTGDAQVAAAARARLGNTLFQLGYQKFVEGPASDGKMPDLATFEKLAGQKLGEWFDPRNEEADGLGTFDSVIQNWTDAVRQYDALSASDSDFTTAKHNRELTVRYLKRLREMLKEQQQAMQQAMQQSGGKQKKKQKGQPGEGDPQDGQDGQGDKGEGEEEEDEEEGEKPNGDENRDKDGKGGEQPKDQPGDKGDKDRKAGESAEDHAKRMLQDKADEAKKPLNGRGTQGGSRQRQPEKDW